MSTNLDKSIVEQHLRRLPVDKLRLLRVFTGQDRYISSATVAGKTHSSHFRATGGRVSSLVRTRIEDKPLVLVAGKEDRQSRLELNEKVVSKQALKEILDNIGI